MGKANSGGGGTATGEISKVTEAVSGLSFINVAGGLACLPGRSSGGQRAQHCWRQEHRNSRAARRWRA
jgi:hypothetical protein